MVRRFRCMVGFWGMVRGRFMIGRCGFGRGIGCGLMIRCGVVWGRMWVVGFGGMVGLWFMVSWGWVGVMWVRMGLLLVVDVWVQVGVSIEFPIFGLARTVYSIPVITLEFFLVEQCAIGAEETIASGSASAIVTYMVGLG